MMKSRIVCLILLMGAFSVSCNETGLSPTNCRDGKCVYRILPDEEIRLVLDSSGLSFRLEEGDKLVFRYEYSQQEDPRVFDDEYNEWLFFQVDKETTNFSFKDEDMKNANFLFYPSCECIPGTTLIEEGTLEGKKISDTQWEVSMDVRFTWGSTPEERKISAIFEME